MTTTIIPVVYDDDMQNIQRRDGCGVVGVDEVCVRYVQQPDTNSESGEYQYLVLKTNYSMPPDEETFKNKESFYVDISMPDCDHWSIDSEDELVAIIQDFKNRVYMATNYNPKPENIQT